MGMGRHTEPLTELVFQGRNRAYGSYQLRRRYLKTLVLSTITGIAIVGAIAVIPLLVFLIRDIQSLEPTGYIYEVEYIPFAPPDDVNLVEWARAHAVTPEEKVLAPVVTDSLPPDEQKPSVETLPETRQEESEERDTASYGTGGEEIGRQANTDTLLSTTIDVYPQYPGGVESRLYYLRRNVVYPKEAVDQGIQGVVMVVFVIETDGSISNISVTQGIGGGCDEEAIRVTRAMPRWTPGKRGGQPVRVMVKMPIVFRLPANRSS